MNNFHKFGASKRHPLFFFIILVLKLMIFNDYKMRLDIIIFKK
jgi:hypothetical protein